MVREHQSTIAYIKFHKEISPDPKSLNGIESDILPIRSQSTRVL